MYILFINFNLSYKEKIYFHWRDCYNNSYFLKIPICERVSFAFLAKNKNKNQIVCTISSLILKLKIRP